MDNALYKYSPIVERPKLVWPRGARIAFYVGLNVEHYEVDKPSTSLFGGTAALVPDPLNFGWRDYGVRVGIWRMMEALDKCNMRASVLLNADVCERYPQIIEAGRKRNWAWLAHGKNNSTLQTGMSVDAERKYLTETVQTVSSATGQKIKGWLGPALSETFETPRLLKELGLTYVLDWCSDDQPFGLNVPGMLSVPYSIELNDVTLFVSKSLTVKRSTKWSSISSISFTGTAKNPGGSCRWRCIRSSSASRSATSILKGRWNILRGVRMSG
jgi:allantoinase